MQDTRRTKEEKNIHSFIRDGTVSGVVLRMYYRRDVFLKGDINCCVCVRVCMYVCVCVYFGLFDHNAAFFPSS